MTEKKYIYVIDAYAYSDFERHILSHKSSMSKKTFFDIVKKAQKLCETKKYTQRRYYDYSENMIACLCQEFGFEQLDYPVVHIGCNTKSKCSMFDSDGWVER